MIAGRVAVAGRVAAAPTWGDARVRIGLDRTGGQMATIGDVAREAGVSRSTVSSVLTGKKFVRPQTRERIEQAIAEPQLLGQLWCARARDVTDDDHRRRGAVARWRVRPGAGALPVSLCPTRPAARGTTSCWSPSRTRARPSTGWRSSAASTASCCSTSSTTTLGCPRSARHDLPAVLLGMPRDSEGVDAVDLDFAAAARKLVRYLHERGPSRRVVRPLGAGDVRPAQLLRAPLQRRRARRGRRPRHDD